MTKEIEIVESSQQETINLKQIKNRFGEFEINLDKKIFFASGLLGMPGYRNFCLTEIPGAEVQTFKLLQSAEEEATAFVTLPLTVGDDGNYPLIENEDIEMAINELEVNKDSLLILLITNFVKNGDKTDIYVNTRAPIIIDADKQAALQYVFANEKYAVRTKISN